MMEEILIIELLRNLIINRGRSVWDPDSQEKAVFLRQLIVSGASILLNEVSIESLDLQIPLSVAAQITLPVRCSHFR